MHQFRFMIQGQMPKLNSVLALTRCDAFTLFVGKIDIRSMAGIHIPKSVFDYGPGNTTRSSIKHAVKKLFGDWIGFGDSHSVTIGWSNYPSIATNPNSYIQSCTFTKGMNEFATLSDWIHKVLSWPHHMQKSGWSNDQIDDWLNNQLTRKRKVKHVSGITFRGSVGPTQSDARTSELDS